MTIYNLNILFGYNTVSALDPNDSVIERLWYTTVLTPSSDRQAWANGIDPDQMPEQMKSDQHLNCLLSSNSF